MAIPKPNINNNNNNNNNGNNNINISNNSNNGFSLPEVKENDNIIYDENNRVVNPYDNDNNTVEYEVDYSNTSTPIVNMPENNIPHQYVNNNVVNDNQQQSNGSHEVFVPNNVPNNSSQNVNVESSNSNISSNDDNDLNTQDTFIDTKNKKLKPFGRKKKEIEIDQIDSRKDLRKRTNIVQYLVIGLLSLLTLLGIYKAIVPPKTLSVSDVKGIVNETTGNTGFPIERGKGFATDFMSAFLQTDSKNANAVQALGYFYSGGKLQTNDSPIRNFSNIKQSILYGPTVYESNALTDYSATYIVGAYVIVTNPDGSPVQTNTNSSSNPSSATTAGKTSSPQPVNTNSSSAKWTFFSVNVFYDKAKDSLAIAPESPAVVSAVNVNSPADIPNEAKIGTGGADDQVTADVKGVVYGFMKAYQSSTTSDHTDLDQYIIPNPPTDLVNGLGNRYTIDSGNDGIKYTTFLTSDPNIVKAEVVVMWREGANSSSSLTYKSTYIMTLQKQSNGKYLVMKFAPKNYFEGEK